MFCHTAIYPVVIFGHVSLYCPYIRNVDGKDLGAFNRMSEDDVSKLLSKSKITNCSTDPIPTKLVKDHKDVLLPLLTHIINTSLSSGIFPDEWKCALVVPLLKKRGLDLELKNYRPVSNLQYLSKLTERALVNQLCRQMEQGFPLPELQSAYRTGHSTETALVKVQSDILMSMDKQLVTQLVRIDLSAAFNTVDHTILLDIMNKVFGVSDMALQWTHSYLRPRSQRVIIEHAMSEKFIL